MAFFQDVREVISMMPLVTLSLVQPEKKSRRQTTGESLNHFPITRWMTSSRLISLDNIFEKKTLKYIFEQFFRIAWITITFSVPSMAFSLWVKSNHAWVEKEKSRNQQFHENLFLIAFLTQTIAPSMGSRTFWDL